MSEMYGARGEGGCGDWLGSGDGCVADGEWMGCGGIVLLGKLIGWVGEVAGEGSHGLYRL